MIELNKIYNEDCLEGAKRIEDGSVDLILTDLPYGNMNTDGGRKIGINGWDLAIDPKKVYEIANRILRKNGKMVLFSQEPYTTKLITEAIPNIPFNYRATWEKDNFAVALGVKVNMVSFTEDILIFSKMHQKHDFEGMHPLRSYFKIIMEFIGLNLKQINNTLGHRRAEHTFYINSTQYGLCTEKTYLELIEVFGINKVKGFKIFAELKALDTEYRTELLRKMNEQYPSTFNLWEGNKYKGNILKYKKDYDGYHPTQKPILLIEDLIKTFSNDNDLIVDLTCGSGSTAVAAINTNRNFIGFELDETYYKIANERLENHINKNKLYKGE
jgi:site-specific DNA-methyltransferase (adenine-specific)